MSWSSSTLSAAAQPSAPGESTAARVWLRASDQSPLGDSAGDGSTVISRTPTASPRARDLLMRGPGEYLGARQSGAPLLRFADLNEDEDLLQSARAAAEVLLTEHPALAQKHLERWLGGRAHFLGA